MSHFLLKTKFCKGLSFSFYKDLSYPKFYLIYRLSLVVGRLIVD
ncbi:hypothetical protein HPHPH42_1293 [Helicobacter pylori Hp H-42]|uniref:Uncharacterized protein n=1 Tax=Helicobacter pylori Hp H-42 TaxID=992047 RepID=A0AB33XGB9_HELPX|nr:hypothetical protein HPHPA4_1278 [Helicobacter pylori Hp A-4]EJB61538.1 hypothetical protein HPHPH42_1293 [Helicobacter pylori Hp H-42]EJB89394.1 hypothetical protein HPHPH19_1428 [Helicobacter pylori Hp H-19]EJC36332.1 hypothetical protein HPHPP28B_1186 [Helicobacter pylori Hp P-28b]